MWLIITMSLKAWNSYEHICMKTCLYVQAWKTVVRVCVCVSMELCSSCEALCWNIAACGIHKSRIIYNTPMPQMITLPVLLITVFYIWSHSVSLFVFCCPSAVFPVFLHVSMSSALPIGLWFMNSILVCHYYLQKGALMDQYVESVTRRIAPHPQISWIFFWQPVACRSSDFDDPRWNIKMLQGLGLGLVLGYFNLEVHHFFWQRSSHKFNVS